MKIPFTGGCAKPASMFKCHCRDCQHATGGAFACVIIVPANSFKFTRRTPRYHFMQGAVGKHKRGFCAECGSRLTGGENLEGTTNIVGINAGSLDDPSSFASQMDIFTCDAQP